MGETQEAQKINTSSSQPCKSGGSKGLDQHCYDKSKQLPDSSKQMFGANMVRISDHDTDLIQLIKVWPNLPGHIKMALLALAGIVNQKEKE